ncbi:ATP-binding protein [Bacillus horti]|uniref:Histidine kinase/HSP90-like ATPase domain-containing protein n=1 Tax=Caldalkalibacillus horti TaxID=77523 RepID=A0ABT9VYR7_9BACI|nr:ATP-binding protein [Bacillus horti]MDQ0166136.1 hypothetical protein [Bacillus horti]
MVEMDIKIPYQKQLEVISEVASPLVVITELIKNAFDECAKEITVEIDTVNNEIEIIDTGYGFSEESIKMLAEPGQSYKKRNNRNLNAHNKVFAGSMGIGLFSIFSIADRFEIITKGEDGEFIIFGDPEKISYDRVFDRIEEGTKVSLINVGKSDIKVLIEDIKMDKLKHISLCNYNKEYYLFELNVKVDGITQDLTSPFVEDLYNSDTCNFKSKIEFSYNKIKRELTYQYIRKNETIINSKPVVIKFDRDFEIGDLLLNHYSIKRVERKEDFMFLPLEANTVSDFEGAFYIREGNKGFKEVSKFGPAVRMYVNGFGMYNYLEREKDWLKLSYLTANVKNSGIKPNNTIGYIAFNHFIEPDEELKISKERSHFYDKTPYRTFYEMVYNVVTLLTFNIDVAARNKNDRDKYFTEEYLKHYDQSLNKGTTFEGLSENGTASDQTDASQTGSNQTGQNQTESEQTDANQTESNQTGQNQTESEQTDANQTESEQTDTNQTGSNHSDANQTNSNQTGGPTPSGDAPGTFFEYISWDGKLNPNDNNHKGLIIALNELHKMSIKKIKEDKREEKLYSVFPVSAGMLLRTAYEQALILHLKRVGQWNVLTKQNNFPMLSNIETHIKQNIKSVFTDKDMRRAFGNIISIRSRDFLNSNIHNPGLIRATSSTLEGITNGGMYSLINLIINNT